MAPALGLAPGSPRLRRPTPNRRRANRRGGMRCRCSARSSTRPASSASITSIRMRRRAARCGRSRSALSTISISWSPASRVRSPARCELIYESLMTPSLDEVSTEYGALAEPVSHPDDFSFVIYRLRPQAKWHDGKPVTPEDVIFSLDSFKTASSAILGLLPPRREGGKDRRARRQVHLRCAGQSRTAADRRPAHDPAEALVGRHRQRRPQARHFRDHAGEAARLRPLPHQGVRRRQDGDAGAGQGLLGPRSRLCRRPQQFRRAALRIFPRRFGGARSLQGRSGRLAHREQRQELGDGLRLPGRQRQARAARGIPEPQLRNHAGLRAESSVAPSSAIPGCAARSIMRSISRR